GDDYTAWRRAAVWTVDISSDRVHIISPRGVADYFVHLGPEPRARGRLHARTHQRTSLFWRLAAVLPPPVVGHRAADAVFGLHSGARRAGQGAGAVLSRRSCLHRGNV